MLKLIPSIFAINSILALIMGAYVYNMNRQKAQNAIWFVYNILFCIWNFCIYKALTSEGGVITRYWFMTSLAALIFVVPVFLHFLSIYSDRKVFKKQILGKIYILFFLFFMASFIIPDEFISSIATTSYFDFIISPGLAFNVFCAIFIGFLFCGFYYLLYSAKLYLGFKRNQRMWIFLGMLIGMTAPISFFLAMYRIDIIPVGIFCVIPYLVIVGYTIIKFHVLEMDILINKTVVLSYFTLLVLFIHMFIVHVLHRIVGIDYFVSSLISGGVVFVNLLFVAHFSGLLKLNKVTNRIVYEKKLNYYKFLENFGELEKKLTDIKDISSFILDSLVETIGLKNATLYLYDEEKEVFELTAHIGLRKEELKGMERISKENSFVTFLKEGNIYVAAENKDFKADHDCQKVKEAFDKINTRFAMPLYYGLPLFHSRDMVGFLNLGDKKDKTAYNKEDIDILNAFGRNLSTSIDRVRLYSHAITDDLTKLYRISYLNKRIQEEIERADRYGREFSLLLMDVDDFKKVNDTRGHQIGDKVLKRVAAIVLGSVRKADIVARYGGDEFSVLMPETTKENAFIGAERTRKAVEKAFVDDKIKITVSIGIAQYKKGMKKYELIKASDEALYKAKREGKNKVS